MTSGTGADERASAISYDSYGDMTGAVNPLGEPFAFAYDPAGRVLQETSPDGAETSYQYDYNGNAASVTPPSGSMHSFTYTPLDLEETYLPPPLEGAGPTSYSYNLDSRLYAE